MATTGDWKTMLYSEDLVGKLKQNAFKVTINSKESHSPETIKGLLKANINPTEIKVGINTLKTLRDERVLIETGSKEEVEVLEKNINEKCRVKLEVNVKRLRNPRLVIYNIPGDISIANAEGTLISQIPDINLEAGDINAKYTCKAKKNTRNVVIEVNAQTRKLLIQKVKLGWSICSTEDCFVANRRSKCPKFNHKH
jgi:hypothetical protein